MSIKSCGNCETHLFCPFSTADKFGVNPQPLPFSTLKAMWQQIFSPCGAKFCCHLTALSDVATLCIWIHTFISTVMIFATAAATSACHAVSTSIQAYNTYLQSESSCSMLDHFNLGDALVGVGVLNTGGILQDRSDYLPCMLFP